MALMRRRLMKAAAGAGLTTSFGFHRLRAQESVIRIPVMLPLSGPLQLVGEPVRLGAEITAQQINASGGVAGRKLELVFLDDKNQPELAAALARETIGAGNRLLIGGMISAPTYAVLPVVQESKSLLMIMGAQGMPFTHESFSKNTFRTTDNEYQRVAAMARLAVDRFPNLSNWSSVIADNAAYRASYALFAHLAGERYKKIGKAATFAEPVICSPTTTDFRNQIAALSSAAPQGLYTILAGSLSVTFWKQAQAFGLPNRLSAVMDQSIDAGVARALRQAIPPNLWTVTVWDAGVYRDLPTVQDFMRKYVALTGNSDPSGYVQYGNTPVVALAAAIRQANGVTEPDSIIKILESGLIIPTNKGNVTFRPQDHQLLGEVVIVHTVPNDTEPGFRIADASRYSGAELVEPPSPGVEFKF